MLKTTEKRMMKLGFHVLLRSTLSNLCLAIPGPLAFQDRVYHSIGFFLLFGHAQYSFFAIVFASRSMQSLLLGTLVFLIKVEPVNLRPYLVDKSGCDICLVDHATQYERYQSVRCGRGILQKHRTNQCPVGTFL